MSFSLPYFILDPKITSHQRVCSSAQETLVLTVPQLGRWYFFARPVLNFMFSVLSFLSDCPTASALVGHFAGIIVLYLLQGCLNLVSPPATCRIPNNEILEGLDLGYYLKRKSEKEIARQTRSRNVEETWVWITIYVATCTILKWNITIWLWLWLSHQELTSNFFSFFFCDIVGNRK